MLIVAMLACSAPTGGRFNADSTPADTAADGATSLSGVSEREHFFVDVKLGWLGGCALDTDGNVACWGYDEYGVDRSPAGMFTSLAVGPSAACALSADGELLCWGTTSAFADAFSVTEPLSAVSVGLEQACTLTADGALNCYGANDKGECDVPDANFATVSASDWVTCALDDLGKVQCWGQNNYGQTDPREEVFSSISAGGADVCGVEAETGRLVRWGRGSAVPGWGASHVVQAACNGVYVCVLRDDGSVACWGEGYSRQWSGPFVAVAVDAESMMCAVRTAGTVDCWFFDYLAIGIQYGAFEIPY